MIGCIYYNLFIFDNNPQALVGYKVIGARNFTVTLHASLQGNCSSDSLSVLGIKLWTTCQPSEGAHLLNTSKNCSFKIIIPDKKKGTNTIKLNLPTVDLSRLLA